MIEVQQNWQEIGDWKGGRVRSSAKVTLCVSLLFGVAFTGLGLPVSLAVPEELAKGNTLALIALLFPLIVIAAHLWIYTV